MNMPMCSRCKKNIAVVFITKIEGPDKTTQEGLCLKCARELGVKPLDNIMEQMGITEDDLEALSGEIGSLADLNDLVTAGSDGSDDDAPHETDPLANPPAPSSPLPPQLGSERRETVRSLSVVGVGNLRGAVLSTRGPGWTHRWCTSCSARSIAG